MFLYWSAAFSCQFLLYHVSRSQIRKKKEKKRKLFRSTRRLDYLEMLENRRLLPLDLLRADALCEMAEQLMRVLLVHAAKLRRPL